MEEIFSVPTNRRLDISTLLEQRLAGNQEGFRRVAFEEMSTEKGDSLALSIKHPSVADGFTLFLDPKTTK